MAVHRPLVHRFVVGVDVEKYSARSTRHQVEIQERLDRILRDAAEAAGLDRTHWERQPGGDGEVAILPDNVDMLAVVRRFVSELDILLTDHNDDHGPDLQIRLRVAMHADAMTPGPFGFAGPALVVLSRLLDCEPVRTALARVSDANLILIVSEMVYRKVVLSELGGLRPGQFNSVEVSVPGKNFYETAYLYLPGGSSRSFTTPVSNTAGPPFFISHADEDIAYVTRLSDLLRSAGLPTWRNADLEWGERFPRRIPAQIQDAAAVIVVMSEAAKASDMIEREILEGQRHDRVFMPILLSGERFFLLAASHFLDARTGRLPGDRELRVLRRLFEARTGRVADPGPVVTPATRVRPSVPAVHVPLDVSLDKLRRFLAEGRIEHADIMTTSLLLDAAGRLENGWMTHSHATNLPFDLLTSINTAWARLPGEPMGFRAQLAHHPQPPTGATPGGSEDFFALAAACGWKVHGRATGRYGEFVATSGAPAGFFPTLRNPQLERHQDWYDRWLETAMAVHLRLRIWSEHQ